MTDKAMIEEMEHVCRLLRSTYRDGSGIVNPDGAEAATAIETLLTALKSAEAEGEMLREALKWAIPLAERCLEDHRSERLRCGHNDIRGTDAKGNVVIGLWQSEIDQRDAARTALTKESSHVPDAA